MSSFFKQPKLGKANRKNSAYLKQKAAYLAARELWGGWWQCMGCPKQTQAPEVDHIKRTGMGGNMTRLLDEANWQILCHDCHVKKDGGMKYA